MARRRRRGGSGQGNLDSLLDTMTNVVGVLIVVLIVTQVNVSSAAKRIRADLPDVTVAMMEEMVEKVEALLLDALRVLIHLLITDSSNISMQEVVPQGQEVIKLGNRVKI